MGVGMPGIWVEMQNMRVRMRGIGVGMQRLGLGSKENRTEIEKAK